jgi:hypothetical protein
MGSLGAARSQRRELGYWSTYWCLDRPPHPTLGFLLYPRCLWHDFKAQCLWHRSLQATEQPVSKKQLLVPALTSAASVNVSHLKVGGLALEI